MDSFGSVWILIDYVKILIDFIYFLVIPLLLSQGQKHGKKLAAKRTKALVDSTNFNEEEIHALNVYFDGLGKKKGKETEIDRAQFKSALGLKESLFINRMFLMFDTGTYFLPQFRVVPMCYKQAKVAKAAGRYCWLVLSLWETTITTIYFTC